MIGLYFFHCLIKNKLNGISAWLFNSVIMWFLCPFIFSPFFYLDILCNRKSCVKLKAKWWIFHFLLCICSWKYSHCVFKYNRQFFFKISHSSYCISPSNSVSSFVVYVFTAYFLLFLHKVYLFYFLFLILFQKWICCFVYFVSYHCHSVIFVFFFSLTFISVVLVQHFM